VYLEQVYPLYYISILPLPPPHSSVFIGFHYDVHTSILFTGQYPFLPTPAGWSPSHPTTVPQIHSCPIQLTFKKNVKTIV
jgi:hypothetical protein